jgi:hypothetical protein
MNARQVAEGGAESEKDVHLATNDMCRVARQRVPRTIQLAPLAAAKIKLPEVIHDQTVPHTPKNVQLALETQTDEAKNV